VREQLKKVTTNKIIEEVFPQGKTIIRKFDWSRFLRSLILFTRAVSSKFRTHRFPVEGLSGFTAIFENTASSRNRYSMLCSSEQKYEHMPDV
jgi:hypothetical protein